MTYKEQHEKNLRDCEEYFFLCDQCTCPEYRFPENFDANQENTGNWPLCKCGHIAQDHN